MGVVAARRLDRRGARGGCLALARLQFLAVTERRAPLWLLYLRRLSRCMVRPHARCRRPRQAERGDDLPAHCGAAGDKAAGGGSALLSGRRPGRRRDRVRDTGQCLLCAGRANARSRHGRPARDGGSGRLACPDSYVRGADTKAVTGYLRRCLAGLEADPRVYTTSLAANDLETVRRRLGYGKIDLYGGSYGATLAQAYARRYPESVRTVVLDSGSLPHVRIFDVSPPVMQNTLSGPSSPAAPPRPRASARTLARGVSSVKCSAARRASPPPRIAKCCSRRTKSPGR